MVSSVDISYSPIPSYVLVNGICICLVSSVAVLNNEITNCESTKVEKVLDVTGAGDLFAAGFLKEYLDRSHIKKCLQTGSKLAAKIIQKIGARLN